MDGSDKEDNMEDNLPTDNSKRDERYPEIDETEETCQENEFMRDTPARTSVKRKSETCLENKRKRSTDNVRKQLDESLLNCTNVQDTLLAEDQLSQIQPTLSPVNLPNKRKESSKESANQADQSTNEEETINLEESHSTTHAIKASIQKYFSSAFNQFENDQYKRLLFESIVNIIINGIIDILKNLKAEINKKQQNQTSGKPTPEIIVSESNEIYDFSKDKTKSIDGYVTDKEQSAFNDSEVICPEYKQDRFHMPIISPGKRKYEQTDEEEIKWKRSADNARIDVNNDENFTDSLNVRDSELCAVHWEKQGKLLVSIADSTEGCVKEQIIGINQTDQSATNYKRTDTSETDYETHESQISNNEIDTEIFERSGKLLLREDANDIARDSSMSKVESSFFSSILEIVKSDAISSQNTVRSKSSSEDKLISQNEGMATKHLGKLDDFCENIKFVFPKKEEDSLVKLLNIMANAELEDDIPLQMNRTSTDTSECEVSNTTNSSKYTSMAEMPRLEKSVRRHPWRDIDRLSPLKLFAVSECDSIPIHNESESNIINLEHMENDPEFIESQKHILESISHQRQSLSGIKHGSDNNKGKFPALLKISPKEIHPKVSLEMASRVFGLVEMLTDVLKVQGRNPSDLSQSALNAELIELAKNYDPDCLPNIPYVTCNYREYMNQSPGAIKIALEKSIADMLEPNQRNLNAAVLEDEFEDTLPYTEDAESTDSSPPESESDNTSETDSTEVREYPEFLKDLTDVKNDAIDEKKMYKLKHTAVLPISLSRDKTSTSQIESIIDSEENIIQFIDRDPRIESRNREDSLHGESGKNLNILKDDDILEEKKSEYQLSKISSASKYKITSFVKESPSSLTSDSSEGKSNLTSVAETTYDLEGSTAQFISTAAPIPSSQAELAILKKEDITTENVSNFQNFPEKPEFNLLINAEDKMVKLPTKMTNKDMKISLDIPLSQSSVNMDNSEVSNISNSSEQISKEVLQKDEMSGFQPIRTSGEPPLFSDSERGLNSTYFEKESTIVNLECMERDPRFIESQKQILASISRQHQPCSSTQSKSDDKENLPESKNKGVTKVGFGIHIKAVLKICNMMQRLDDFLKSRGRNSDDLTELDLINMLIKIARVCVPDCIAYIPHVIINYRECLKQLPQAINIAYQRSIEERLENNRRALNPLPLVDNSSDTLSNDSPDSTPENEPDKISETDFPEFREYPGLAKDPTSVKKDARYQKKFYKENNPVRLPITWSGNKAPICEIEPNVDSENNKIHDNLQIVSISENSVQNGNSEGDSKNILQDNKRESPEDKLSVNLTSSSESKISSIMEESPNKQPQSPTSQEEQPQSPTSQEGLPRSPTSEHKQSDENKME